VGVFFSGHWCPPSRQFTPDLIDAYDRWARARNFVRTPRAAARRLMMMMRPIARAHARTVRPVCIHTGAGGDNGTGKI
jgi:hypothetical protein